MYAYGNRKKWGAGLLVMLGIVFSSMVASGEGTVEAPRALEDALKGARQGTVVGLAGLDILAAPHLPQIYEDVPEPLVFSDAPESPDIEGILYVDTLSGGRARLYQYQVSGAPGGALMSFPIVLSNPGARDVKVTVEARGVAGPSSDYWAVGLEAGLGLLRRQRQPTFVVNAGEAVVLDRRHARLKAAYYQLITGMFDVVFSGPLRVYFLAVKPGTDPLEAYQTLPVLPHPGVHARGTFATHQRKIMMPGGVTYDTSEGVQQIVLGLNTPNDPNVQGVDATDSTAVDLGGNFGVLYHSQLRVRSTDGRRLAILVNPRGGYHGSIVDMPSGITPGGLFTARVPVAKVTAGVLGRFAPSHQGETISFFWLTAGASYLPVRILLVPYSQ